MDHDVVGRIQALALEFIGDHGDGSVVFVAHDAAAAMLAGKLASLKIEGVAVAVSGGTAEHADRVVLFAPAHLHVIRDVAPNQEAADAIPGGPFGPERSGVVPFDHRVADDVTLETFVQRNDVGIGILDRRAARIIARRGNRRYCLRLRAHSGGNQRDATECRGQERTAIGERRHTR